MLARLDRAAERGCDGVEPDNVDGYTNESGFSLSACDQLDFNRFLAREAHARGLSVGLKNDLDQVTQLVGDFDWALNEQCFEFDECGGYAPWIADGKAVFQVEYRIGKRRFCDDALAAGFSSIKKARSFSLFAKPWKLCR